MEKVLANFYTKMDMFQITINRKMHMIKFLDERLQICKQQVHDLQQQYLELLAKKNELEDTGIIDKTKRILEKLHAEMINLAIEKKETANQVYEEHMFINSQYKKYEKLLDPETNEDIKKEQELLQQKQDKEEYKNSQLSKMRTRKKEKIDYKQQQKNHQQMIEDLINMKNQQKKTDKQNQNQDDLLKNNHHLNHPQKLQKQNSSTIINNNNSNNKINVNQNTANNIQITGISPNQINNIIKNNSNNNNNQSINNSPQLNSFNFDKLLHNESKTEPIIHNFSQINFPQDISISDDTQISTFDNANNLIHHSALHNNYNNQINNNGNSLNNSNNIFQPYLNQNMQNYKKNVSQFSLQNNQNTLKNNNINTIIEEDNNNINNINQAIYNDTNQNISNFQNNQNNIINNNYQSQKIQEQVSEELQIEINNETSDSILDNDLQEKQNQINKQQQLEKQLKDFIQQKQLLEEEEKKKQQIQQEQLKQQTLQQTQPILQSYCFCGLGEFGDMISCENDQCKREWFHYACVGLEGKTEQEIENLGEWYCSECLQKKKFQKKQQQSLLKLKLQQQQQLATIKN